MPDDRLFHKRLGHSEKVGQLTDFEYIVWQAYVLSADDFGVLRLAAVSLQADHDRLAAKPAKAIQRALARVCALGLLGNFEHQGRAYGYQADWQDWQHVDYPRATIHPAPPADELNGCSEATRKLFERHPGGWRKKPEGAPKHSAHLRDTLDTPSEEITRKPLAVSQEPVAVSRQPLAAVPAPAESRSKRPIFKGQSFVVFEWQLDDLRRMLGPHAEQFDLHAWFFDLDAKVVAAALVVPQRDGGQWLQAETLAEAMRRGLPVAASAAAPVGKTAGNAAAAARFVARRQG